MPFWMNPYGSWTHVRSDPAGGLGVCSFSSSFCLMAATRSYCLRRAVGVAGLAIAGSASDQLSSHRTGCCWLTGLASASANWFLTSSTSAFSRATSALYGHEECFNLRFAKELSARMTLVSCLYVRKQPGENQAEVGGEGGG